MDITAILQIAADNAVPVLKALAVFIIGRWVAGVLSRSIQKNLSKAPNADPSLTRFFASIVKYLILFATAIAALTVLGINTSSMTGMIVGLGAAMAFILQDSLSNLAAGVMLLIFRPYNVGDEVEIGDAKGIVTSLELTATRLKSADNVEVIVANSKAWGGTVRNHTSAGQRRLDIDFGIDYSADIDKAIKVITSTAAKNPRVHEKPAPWAKVVLLNESSVDLQLRIWCDAKDYKALSTEISQPIKAALDKAGIGIPYPHEVKIKQKVKSSKGRNRIKKLKAAKLKNS